jgi:class 3 adenylate cyclase
VDVPSQPPGGTIALLFTDIEGSTRLAAALGSGWAGVPFEPWVRAIGELARS